MTPIVFVSIPFVIVFGAYCKKRFKKKQLNLPEQIAVTQINIDDLFFQTTTTKQRELEQKIAKEKIKQQKIREEKDAATEKFKQEVTTKYCPNVFSFLADRLAETNTDPNGEYIEKITVQYSNVGIDRDHWNIFQDNFIVILDQKNIKYNFNNTNITIYIKSLREYFNKLKEERSNKQKIIITAPYR